MMTVTDISYRNRRNGDIYLPYFAHNSFNYPGDYFSKGHSTYRSKISAENGAIHQQHEQEEA